MKLIILSFFEHIVLLNIKACNDGSLKVSLEGKP